jgi:SAM-dependent methyltransferase
MDHDKSPTPIFDLEAVFEVDDYLYFYNEVLIDERSDEEVRALVSLLELDKPAKLLDLACGFGRHTNRIAALGHEVIGDSMSGRFYNHRIVIRNGVRKDKPFFVRLYNPNEIRDLLRQAGLEVYRMYGGWDARPVSTESRRMVIIARKP